MLQLNKRIPEPREEEAERSDDRVRARPRAETPFHLRPIRGNEARPSGGGDFDGAFEIVTKAAEAMERAERQARAFRVNALKHFERYQGELAEARAEVDDLRALLADRDAELKDAELRVRAATLRAKDSEARLEDGRKQMMAIEGELAGTRQWLNYFESHLSDRFKNAARALAEMADASFETESTER